MPHSSVIPALRRGYLAEHSTQATSRRPLPSLLRPLPSFLRRQEPTARRRSIPPPPTPGGAQTALGQAVGLPGRVAALEVAWIPACAGMTERKRERAWVLATAKPPRPMAPSYPRSAAGISPSTAPKPRARHPLAEGETGRAGRRQAPRRTSRRDTRGKRGYDGGERGYDGGERGYDGGERGYDGGERGYAAAATPTPHFTQTQQTPTTPTRVIFHLC